MITSLEATLGRDWESSQDYMETSPSKPESMHAQMAAFPMEQHKITKVITALPKRLLA